MRSTPPTNTFLSDAVRAWVAARLEETPPAPDILALATLPERIVRSRFGTGPGQDRYVWITPDFTIGSASAYYGAQDKRLCVDLASEKKLPVLHFVVDEYDAPFGLVRSLDRQIAKLCIDRRGGVIRLDHPERGHDVLMDCEASGKVTSLSLDPQDSPLGSPAYMEFAIDNPLPDVLARTPRDLELG